MTPEVVDLSCTRCRLSRSRKQVVPGKGSWRTSLVLVGEAPGSEEDRRGEPFVGRAGKLLDETLADGGASRQDVFIANLVKCRPPGNRRPRKDEIEACARFLQAELQRIRPKVICAMGQTVAAALIGCNGRMSSLVGRVFDAEVHGVRANVVISYHPAACLYQRKNLSAFREAIRTSLHEAGLGKRASKPH
ncbi:MAG: uracil-DNA glycosylase [Thermoplasmata archaeon]